MGLGIPGRTGSTRHTELGALNEIIKRLTDLRNAFTSGASGDATLAEQQLQTAELIDVNSELALILAEITTSLNTANAPSHEEVTNPAAYVINNFKELSFVCSGTITVTLDGNPIVYPYTLGAATILGSTIKADTVSTNSVTFNGAGIVLLTISQ